jgi:chemotaxis protein methyltransferase CheR
MEDRDFVQFIANVKRKTGIDLAQYKEAQMKRRLTSLRMKRGFDSFAPFFEGMMKNQELFDEFLDRMTINVSEFFRNPSRWQVLENKIIPRMLKEKGKIKCWSAACSTGEEPYSLAMLLSRFTPLREVDITATDLDEGAIARAKKGIYTERSLQDAPKDLVIKYFKKDGTIYAVSDEIKRLIKFKRHNMLADPFEKNYDLIVCRNVMIYFTEEANNELYHKFSASLRTGGVLFVGSTEQIFQPQQYGFEPDDTFFYRKV